ncbi:MAG: hypothetical protein HKN17_04245 [Rhodothermales bacterium]|nr:hypothetical protein [Rhodothermales bacterium]
MKRLTALALLLLTTALYSEPQTRHDLEHVGVSVALPSSWQLRGEESIRIPGTAERYGFTYLIDSDVTRADHVRFDEVLVERFDNIDAAERRRLIDGAYRAGESENIRLEEAGPLPIDISGFEDVSVFRYRESRGSERHQQSAGFVLFAVDGTQAWRVKVGGLDRAFQLDPARYRRILESVRLEHHDAGDNGVSGPIPVAAGG